MKMLKPILAVGLAALATWLGSLTVIWLFLNATQAGIYFGRLAALTVGP